MLFFLDPKQEHRKRVIVPQHLREQLLQENHSSPMGGHFAGKMYGSLVCHWWWDGMYADTLRYAHACPQCATVSGGGKPSRPPLHPIPVRRLFQIVGVDIKELPCTDQGNCYVLVFQDFVKVAPRLSHAGPEVNPDCSNPCSRGSAIVRSSQSPVLRPRDELIVPLDARHLCTNGD